MDTDAPIVSSFVGKSKNGPTEGAATKPAANEKKRAHDQVDAKPKTASNPPTFNNTTKQSAQKPSLKPPAPKRSKFILEEADESDDDVGEDLGSSDDEDSFIDNGEQEDDEGEDVSFVDNGEEEDEE